MEEDVGETLGGRCCRSSTRPEGGEAGLSCEKDGVAQSAANNIMVSAAKMNVPRETCLYMADLRPDILFCRGLSEMQGGDQTLYAQSIGQA